MEAIEVHAAERPGAATLSCAWDGIDPMQRSPLPDDFAEVREGLAADTPLEWLRAERIGDGSSFFVPRAAVLLDFAGGAEDAAGVEISSNGQGAHFSLAAATLKGLLELVERDAMAEAERGGTIDWRLGRVHVEPGHWPWFDALIDRARASGISVWLYRFPALAGIRVLCCEMREPGAFPAPQAIARGVAAGFCNEEALRGAVAEAAQVRLTNIAFAREDLMGVLPGRPIDAVPPLAFVVRPNILEPAATVGERCPVASVAQLSAGLAEAGYPDIVRFRLDTGTPDVHAVRMFVPGLGSGRRRRRKRAG